MTKRAIFGIHSVTPYRLSDGVPYSKEPFKVLGSFSCNLTQEIINLNGGSNFDVWDTELGNRTTEGTMLLREYPNALFEIATGQAVTDNTAQSGGSVSALRNIKGSSVFEAATGIASVGVKSGSEANVPYARITVVAVSPTTVDIYADSDIDFAQGAAKAFQSGSQKVNSSPITITTGGAVEIPDFGIELTGGSGTIGMTIGDTATFESKPINTASREVVVGGELARPQNIGIIAYSQRRSSNIITKINIHSALVSGLPLPFTEKAFAEGEITFTPKFAPNIFTGEKALFTFSEVDSTN